MNVRSEAGGRSRYQDLIRRFLVISEMASSHSLFLESAPEHIEGRSGNDTLESVDILSDEMSGILESVCDVQDSSGIPPVLSETSRDREVKKEVNSRTIRIREWILDQATEG
ncbi:uncharacterized protein [Pocillopora verrucosa]|uniref:uncharacterized protein isoform X2 n=1 Tax=Pocillopora verrucosa TaxID=203993 RepID=UPI00334137B4